MLELLALLLGSAGGYASGYRDVSRANQSYPIMAKYDKDGILRYCDGKRAGRIVPGWPKVDTTPPSTKEQLNGLGCALVAIVFVIILIFAISSYGV